MNILKYKIWSLALCFAFIGFYSCGDGATAAEGGSKSGDSSKGASSNSYQISGVTQNYPIGTKVLLQNVRGKSATTIDTASIKADGTFLMEGNVQEKDFARLLIGRTPAFLILDNENINITMDQKNPRGTLISGSDELNSLQALTTKLQSGAVNPTFISNFVDTVKSPLVAYIAMSNVQFEKGVEVYEKVAKRFENEMPGSGITTDLRTFITQNKTQAEAKRKAAAKTATGSMAADISLPNPDGKTMSLSDLKGKVVLLDFWASWCGPCRKENPTVVRNYKKYKDKGFEVFSVSLDSRTERWQKAIEQDGLIWPYHVSDLKKWGSAPAAAYGVRSIPATFLIDRDGKIIGKNLRGPRLEAKLAELFGAA